VVPGAAQVGRHGRRPRAGLPRPVGALRREGPRVRSTVPATPVAQHQHLVQ
jgi:hypothetical protein